jgi:hypothetical protein
VKLKSAWHLLRQNISSAQSAAKSLLVDPRLKTSRTSAKGNRLSRKTSTGISVICIVDDVESCDATPDRLLRSTRFATSSWELSKMLNNPLRLMCGLISPLIPIITWWLHRSDQSFTLFLIIIQQCPIFSLFFSCFFFALLKRSEKIVNQVIWC